MDSIMEKSMTEWQSAMTIKVIKELHLEVYSTDIMLAVLLIEVKIKVIHVMRLCNASTTVLRVESVSSMREEGNSMVSALDGSKGSLWLR